jgi:hypothetical protein
MEVAALRTTPLGWPPESVLRCVDTRTLTSVVPESSVHRCSGDELRLAQKLPTIRCDSFIMLRFPSGVTANRKETRKNAHILSNSIHRSAASTGAVRGITSGDVVVRHAEGGHGREPLARTLQRGEPAVRPERGAAQHEVAVEDVDREHLLDLHVFDPGHLQHT